MPGYAVTLHLKFKLGNQYFACLNQVNVWFFTVFHSIPRVLRVLWNIVYIAWQHACFNETRIIFYGMRGIHEFQINKNGRLYFMIVVVDGEIERTTLFNGVDSYDNGYMICHLS